MRFSIEAVDILTKATRLITVDADGEPAARSAAMSELQPGETVGAVQLVRKARGSRRRLSQDQLTDFCLELNELLGGGSTLPESLQAVRRSATDRQIVAMLDRMITAAAKGADAGRVFEAEEHLLGPLAVSMVVQGAAIRDVPGSLVATVKMLDRDAKRSSMLTTNLAMPTLASIGLLVAGIVFGTFVIPMMRDQIEPGAHLNLLTRICYAYSDVVRDTVWVWAPALAAAAYFTVTSQAFRSMVWKFIENRFPRARKASEGVLHGDFCSAMGTLLKGGMNIHETILFCAERFGRTPLGGQLKKVAVDVGAGGDVASALEVHTSLPHKSIEAVRIALKARDAAAFLSENAERAYFRAEREYFRFGIQASVLASIGGAVGAVVTFLGCYAPTLSNIMNLK